MEESCKNQQALARFLAPAAMILLLFIQISPSEALNSDGQSLLSFKKSIFSDPQRAMSDWDDSDATPCRWSGIACSSIRGESEPRVQSIALARRKLVGSIHPDLGTLPYLQHLNLRDNQLIGAIPPAIFNATALESLLLSDNDLSGNIPASILLLADTLDTLDLSGNGFSGGISILAGLSKIRFLILARNRFSGEIPEGFPVSLERLDLSSNMLQGGVPADLGDLPLLQGTLNLSDNRLQGEIPASLGRLPISLSIDLSFNNLSGPIPLNGTLSNQGPTAFLGNPGLCGLPLKIRCQQQGEEQAEPARMPVFGNRHRPPNTESSSSSSGLISSSSNRSGLSSKQVVAIAVGDSVGIVLIAAALGYCFYCRRKRNNASDDQKNTMDTNTKNKPNVQARFPCGCVRDGSSDTEMDSDDANSTRDVFYGQLGGEGGGELLHFDAESDKLFDLDALLRASAYVLGKGSSGIVYKAVMEGGLTMVVRRLGDGDQSGGAAAADSSSSKKVVKEFESEVKFLGSIRHPNVVPLRAYYWGMNEKLLVYDFLPRGSLAAAIEQHQHHWILQEQHGLQGEEEHRLSWPRRLSIAKDIARGLAFLHEGTTRRNIHGNLKPSNVLLDAGGHACIADIGIGRLCEILACHDNISSTSSLRSDVAAATAAATPPGGSMRANVDAPGPSDPGENPTAAVASCSSSMSLYVSASSSIYRPPEASSPSSRPTQKWDVYSFGAILLEMLTGSASAQLACSDLDMVMAVRKMLLSSSSSYSTSHVDAGAIANSSSSNGTTTTTTTMLMAGIRAEAEATELLHVALRCVSAAPDQRPKMKHVVDALQKIGTS